MRERSSGGSSKKRKAVGLLFKESADRDNSFSSPDKDVGGDESGVEVSDMRNVGKKREEEREKSDVSMPTGRPRQR